jgi:hypothetical protein
MPVSLLATSTVVTVVEPTPPAYPLYLPWVCKPMCEIPGIPIPFAPQGYVLLSRK